VSRLPSQRTEERKEQIRENPIRALAKAVHLLEVLAEEREATPRRLATLLDEPRTTTYRLLRSLEALDLVEPGSQPGAYRLGWKLMRLGAAVVERLEGLRVQSLALRLGGSLPLHAGAGPRALLAWEPRTVWEEYVRSVPLKAVTDRTPATGDALFRELEETVAQGYALSDEDVTPGIASLGAPIFDYTGNVRAALSIGGLKSLVLGDNREEFVGLLTQSAREISAALGHSDVPADAGAQ